MALSYSFLLVPGVAAVAVGHGVLGVESDRLVVVGDGLVVLLLGVPGVGRGRCTPGRSWGRAGWPRRSRRWPCRTPPWRTRRRRGCCTPGRPWGRGGSPRRSRRWPCRTPPCRTRRGRGCRTPGRAWGRAGSPRRSRRWPCRTPPCRTRRGRGCCTPGVLGIEADGLGEVGDGLVVLPLVVPGAAAVDVRHGELGIEADRLAEVGDGLVVLLLVVPGAAAVVYARASLGSRRIAWLQSLRARSKSFVSLLRSSARIV